jgi:YVTN family beta-propeller protein
MDIVLVSNGFGQLLPHQAFALREDGSVSDDLIDVREMSDLLENVSGINPIQATPRLSDEARLPSGIPGNQFIYVRFTNALDLTSVLSDSAVDQANSGLTGKLVVEAVDPASGSRSYVSGRAFVNGQTYAGSPVGSPPRLPLQTWVSFVDGQVVAEDVDNNDDGIVDGLGFPGSFNSFTGVNQLFSENTFVFIPDVDDDLTTFETFPVGVEIRVEIKDTVLDMNGKFARRQAVACTSVGLDTSSPESFFTPPPIFAPFTVPQDGDLNADPMTSVRLFFTEAIQPRSLGNLPSASPPELSGSVQLAFGPETTRVQVPFFVEPVSVLDLTTWDLLPAFNFPGQGPEGEECGAFDTVDVILNAGLFEDLSGNTNTLSGTSSFRTGEGPGIVNAPVVPEVIYAGRQGAANSLSVIDLNGFGAGTGNPNWEYQNYEEGNSNFPNDPNVFFQGSQMLPPLLPGTCTFNGGSAGVFTLTKDSSLDDRVLRAPLVGSVDDVAIGAALDQAFNNGPAPFGCQSGGGNLCATTGIKTIPIVVQGNTASTAGGPGSVVVTGVPNLVSSTPHPNPPPLDFPPMCVSPFLFGQEPTSIDTTLAPPLGPGLQNQLNPGNPFPARTNPTTPVFNVPPTGLLAEQATIIFAGPSLPDTIQSCLGYQLRQQVGHFMYVLDRSLNQVTVVNSNRMIIVDRIIVPSPTSLAMGTNLDMLAVSSGNTNSVYFIDTDPSSATFHEIVKVTTVGDSPSGIAWDPSNEDILVCNEGDDSVSIISAFSLQVRKEVTAFMDRPFEVCITPRQQANVQGFGFNRNVYFAYILNRSGDVAVFESGPNTVNGWGYDDLIGVVPYNFKNAKTIQPDYLDVRSGFWVMHEGPFDFLTEEPGELGVPAATNIVFETGNAGQIQLSTSSLLQPQLRDINFGIKVSFGQNVLSGIPVDVAFDNLLNLGGTENLSNPYSAGSPVIVNGKNLVRAIGGGGAAVPTCNSRYAFFSVPNSLGTEGAVDVISLSNFTRFDVNPYEDGTQSIEVPGVKMLADYFRQ